MEVYRDGPCQICVGSPFRRLRNVTETEPSEAAEKNKSANNNKAEYSLEGYGQNERNTKQFSRPKKPVRRGSSED